MQEYDIAFARLSDFMPFLHIASVAFFTGIQGSFWLIFRRFMKENAKPKAYQDMLNAVKDFGYVLLVCLILIVITGFLMSSNEEIKIADPIAKALLNTKYTLAGFLALNLGYMAYCYTKAVKAFKKDEMVECYENIFVVIRYFMPLNLIVSLIAIYLGVAYKDC